MYIVLFWRTELQAQNRPKKVVATSTKALIAKSWILIDLQRTDAQGCQEFRDSLTSSDARANAAGGNGGEAGQLEERQKLTIRIRTFGQGPCWPSASTRQRTSYRPQTDRARSANESPRVVADYQLDESVGPGEVGEAETVSVYSGQTIQEPVTIAGCC